MHVYCSQMHDEAWAKDVESNNNSCDEKDGKSYLGGVACIACWCIAVIVSCARGDRGKKGYGGSGGGGGYDGGWGGGFGDGGGDGGGCGGDGGGGD